MRLSSAAALCTLCVFAQSAASIGNPDWVKPFPPFRIIGNVYWDGTWDLSTYLIATPKGIILINTGLRETEPQIEAGIKQLGFKLSDVKILTATHGHFDHVAALAELRRKTGAQVVMSDADADLLESGGKSDFRFGDDPTARFEPVKVDRRLRNGDRIELGGVTLTAHLHPGHTKGATSFTLDVRENGRTYRVGIVNMASINPGVRVTGMPKYPGIGDDYAKTFEDQNHMKIDVWLSSHASQFHLHEKYKPGDPYRPDRFVDPDGYHAAVEHLQDVYRAQLAKEQHGTK